MNRIRLATEDEIKGIEASADLMPGSMVLALDTQNGTPLTVIRSVVEADPVYFPDGFPARMKAMFIRDVETVLAAKAVPAYYFNIFADESSADWRQVVENWGAIRVSQAPEIRYKKVL